MSYSNRGNQTVACYKSIAAKKKIRSRLERNQKQARKKSEAGQKNYSFPCSSVGTHTLTNLTIIASGFCFTPGFGFFLQPALYRWEYELADITAQNGNFTNESTGNELVLV